MKTQWNNTRTFMGLWLIVGIVLGVPATSLGDPPAFYFERQWSELSSYSYAQSSAVGQDDDYDSTVGHASSWADVTDFECGGATSALGWVALNADGQSVVSVSGSTDTWHQNDTECGSYAGAEHFTWGGPTWKVRSQIHPPETPVTVHLLSLGFWSTVGDTGVVRYVDFEVYCDNVLVFSVSLSGDWVHVYDGSDWDSYPYDPDYGSWGEALQFQCCVDCEVTVSFYTEQIASWGGPPVMGSAEINHYLEMQLEQ